jgi:hypothetical protein
MTVTPIPADARKKLVALRHYLHAHLAQLEQQRLAVEVIKRDILVAEYEVISSLKLNNCHVFSDDDRYLVFDTSAEAEKLVEKRWLAVELAKREKREALVK